MAALRLPYLLAARWPPPPSSDPVFARWLHSPRRAPRRLAARRAKGEGPEQAEAPVRTPLIDDYDSYTYDIFLELSVVKVPPVVVRNDEWTWRDVYNWVYKERAFDNIVISPGPGSPACPSDIGICLRILCECGVIPILGVCLGHQALGFVHGAKIGHAPEAIHGRLSEIEHNGCHLFNHIPSGINSGFKVVRYHSLVIEAGSLSEDLVSTAWTASPKLLSFLESDQPDITSSTFWGSFDNLLVTNPLERSSNGGKIPNINNAMESDGCRIGLGIRHSSRPHYGVQVNSVYPSPEKNSANLCNSVPSDLLYTERRKLWDSVGACMLAKRSGGSKCLQLRWKKIDTFLSHTGGSENIFSPPFGHQNAEDTFWLDSSSDD